MSKSLGNFVTIRDALAGDSGDVLRLTMLRTHYRQPIDWTRQAREESAAMLAGWERRLRTEKVAPSTRLPDSVLEPLLDDMNTPLAITELHALHRQGRLQELADALAALGFVGISTAHRAEPGHAELSKLIDERAAARKAKDFKKADAIRQQVELLGYTLLDSKNPKTGELVTTWEVKR